MNLKKKPERYSYKKLLSTTRRPQQSSNNQYNIILQKQKQKNSHHQYHSSNHQNQNRSTSKNNKSSQKILSVYQASKGKFKIGRFLASNQRQHRIKTQSDELQKTKYNKINSVRKVNNNDQKIMTKQVGTINKIAIGNYESKGSGRGTQQKVNSNRLIYQNTKKRVFNKRLNLNSQLFQNLNKNSLEKYDMPQTSKNHIQTSNKNVSTSFRKQHDSFRSKNKKTALEKYISQSLQNLDQPLKKKNKFIQYTDNHAVRNPLQIDTDQEIITMKMDSSSKEKNNFTKGTRQKAFFEYASKQLRDKDSSLSKQKKKLNINASNQIKNSKNKNIFDYVTQEQQPYQSVRKEEKTIRSPRQQNYHQQSQINSHRRLKTQVSKQKQRNGDSQSIQKIEIKWQKKKKNPYDLSNQELDTFGDRFPDGFDKVKLLGRGGFSLVWLGQHKKSKKKYAVKQIITESSHQTHIKEIWFGTYFFQFGGAPKEEFVNHPGIKNLVKLYYYFINKKDTWILYQKCGDSLGNALYQLKGQHYNGQKMYRIHYKHFYDHLRQNQSEIRKIILQVSKALQLLAENNIIHSDLKTQNILVKLSTNNINQAKTVSTKQPVQNPTLNDPLSILQEVKLIDYGSSFVFNNLRQFSMATPQYMAPQILNFILYQNQLQYIPKLFDYVQQYHDPWVIDIWSLGSVILEIISGIPLWMSLKTIVKRKGKQLIRFGLFAVKGRTFDKIIKKQLEVVQNIQKILNQQNYSDIVVEQDIKYLLKRMLALNPAKRISPTEIIDYLTKNQVKL